MIEYDGEQHFKPINFGGISNEKAYENYNINKKHDEIKNNYSKLHNIKLIRIPYYDFKDIEKILNKELKINNNLQEVI